MRTSRFLSAAIFIGGLAISFSAWAPPGGNNGKGGQGGGESELRLCADFASSTAPYTNSDGESSEITPFQYCDGFDGEILMGDDFLKLSTTTRNPAERTVRVMINSADCTTADPVLNPDGSPRLMDLSGNDLDAFFGWAQNQYGPASCVTGDPFADEFNPDNLQCLGDLERRNALMELTEDDGTVYQAWQMRLAHPDLSLKRAPESAFVFQFAGGLGPDQCSSPHGLPVAIRCTLDTNGVNDCEGYQLKTFRACVADYDANKGGNWHQAYAGCEMNAEITFTRKP